MKKITVILMLIMLMSICAFDTPNSKPNVHKSNVSKEAIRKPNVHKSNVSKEAIRKPNVHKSNVSKEAMRKAIAKSKNKPMAISKEIQARREKQYYPVEIKHHYIH